MAKNPKYYVVWHGRETGILNSWEDCKAAINGINGAQYMAFPTLAEAEKAYSKEFADYKGKSKKKEKPSAAMLHKAGEPNLFSIAVDAASSGNPGKMEYRGVDTQTGKQLFYQGPFQQGTNNIGEFLALVHGLAFLKKHGSSRSLYSDSRIAMGWVKKKKCNTKLKAGPKNKPLFELIERAETWLKNNSYTTEIMKWETKAWGEIPADFGRK